MKLLAIITLSLGILAQGPDGGRHDGFKAWQCIYAAPLVAFLYYATKKKKRFDPR